MSIKHCIQIVLLPNAMLIAPGRNTDTGIESCHMNHPEKVSAGFDYR